LGVLRPVGSALASRKSSKHRGSFVARETPKIYLTGPVTGVAESAQSTWRDKLRLSVEPAVRLIDPLADGAIRSPLYRRAAATSMPSMQAFGALTIARNKEAIQSCDMLFANLSGCRTVSLGSVGEIFWADAYRKPILIIREALENPHDHLLLNQVATWMFFNLDEGIRQVRTFFDLPFESAGAENL
jgi:hypothetical protein